MRVRKLQPLETVGLEFERVEWLLNRYGPEKGEIELGTAMEEMAAIMHEVYVAWERSDAAAVRIHALALQSVADRLGMLQAARVAGDVIAVSSSDDAAALAATVSRLCRVGERSLIAIWDAQLPG